MIRTILLASAMTAGLSGAALATWDPPLPPGAHSAAVSQGLPSAVGQDQGESAIHYTGRAQGNLSAGVPVMAGNEGGDPVIVYRPPALVDVEVAAGEGIPRAPGHQLR